MKIVNRKTFLSLPENTLFSKYEPCAFNDLTIKMESLEFDFFSQEIVSSLNCESSSEFEDILYRAEGEGTSFDMNFNDPSRDGFLDKDQLFAVWERKDIEALIERLRECLK